LLNDKTQEQLSNAKSEKAAIQAKIALLESNITFNSDVFGIDDSQKIMQPNEIISYNELLNKHKRLIADGTIDSSKPFSLDYDKYINFFSIKRDAIQAQLDVIKAALDNIVSQENELKSTIAELKDRKLLNSKFSEISGAIINLKVIERLNKHKNKLSTNSISRKTSEAREELVKHNFIDIFHKELAHLRKSKIKVDLNFGTVKGSSRVQQKINANYNLSDILSEGEQKAIALAEYLTELQLDNSHSPVIFDDPVNSLDHHVIEDVAKRLLLLSEQRQVLICTHSVILFNSLMHQCGQPPFNTLDKKFYNSKNQYGISGYIVEADEEINGVTESIKAINKLFNPIDKTRQEEDIAAEGFAHLRAAIELCVENKIFRQTVRRYKKNIMLSAFVKVNGALLDTHKYMLNDIYDRCCGYIAAHSNPTEIGDRPTLDALTTDFESFKAINTSFKD